MTPRLLEGHQLTFVLQGGLVSQVVLLKRWLSLQALSVVVVPAGMVVSVLR